MTGQSKQMKTSVFVAHIKSCHTLRGKWKRNVLCAIFQVFNEITVFYVCMNIYADAQNYMCIIYI